MNTTKTTSEQDPAGRDWTAMRPEDFDTRTRPVQGALFAEPDPCGTPGLFDGAA